MKNNFREKDYIPYYGGTVSTISKNLHAYFYIRSVYDNAINNIDVVSQSPELIDDLLGILNKYKKLTLEIKENENDKILKYEKVIKEYKNILTKETDERVFQKFFEKNYTFFDILVRKCIPKPNFGGEKQPDFILIIENENYIIVEIETPDKKLFRKNNVQTAEFTERIDQISSYLKWIRNNAHILRDRGYSINSENTSGLLLIGLRESLTREQKKKLEEIKYNNRHLFKIKTFDDVYKENLTILNNIKKI